MLIQKNESIVLYESLVSGPSVILMAGVHGNEHSGIIALQRIIQEGISLLCGKLTIIFANLDAIEHSVRFVDVNMNRCFGTEFGTIKEEQRIQEILPYLHSADILLDLHNTIDLSAHPFLISEHPPYNNLFDCDIVLSGLDDLHPGGSDSYMNLMGKVGLCLECGSISDDINITSEYAYIMSKNFLMYFGMIKGRSISYSSQKDIACNSIYFSSTDDFILKQGFQEFEYCAKDQIIGYDGGNVVTAPYDGYIAFARNTKNKGSECFIYGYEKVI